MQENSALMLNNSFGIKSFDFENRAEPLEKSLPLPVLVVPLVAPGGAVTKTEAKKPLKYKNAAVLTAVAGDWTKSRKENFKKLSAINVQIN